MKSLLKKILLITFVSSAVSHAEELLYTGLTDTGWQIFQRSIETQEERQLTHSLGDKRSPVYSEEFAGVLFKGSEGRIWLVDGEGTESVLVDIKGCSDFTVNGKDIYFICFVTDNPQRQYIWKAKGDYPTSEMELVYRVNDATFRQLHCHEGVIMATYIWRTEEEMITVIEPRLDESEPLEDDLQPISKEFTTSSYPRWINGDQAIVSIRNEDMSYDLHVIDVNNSKVSKTLEGKQLTKSSDYSEFASAISGDGLSCYAERRDKKGLWSIVAIDMKTGAAKDLQIERPAKEPFIIK